MKPINKYLVNRHITKKDTDKYKFIRTVDELYDAEPGSFFVYSKNKQDNKLFYDIKDYTIFKLNSFNPDNPKVIKCDYSITFKYVHHSDANYIVISKNNGFSSITNMNAIICNAVDAVYLDAVELIDKVENTINNSADLWKNARPLSHFMLNGDKLQKI